MTIPAEVRRRRHSHDQSNRHRRIFVTHPLPSCATHRALPSSVRSNLAGAAAIEFAAGEGYDRGSAALPHSHRRQQGLVLTPARVPDGDPGPSPPWRVAVNPLMRPTALGDDPR